MPHRRKVPANLARATRRVRAARTLSRPKQQARRFTLITGCCSCDYHDPFTIHSPFHSDHPQSRPLHRHRLAATEQMPCLASPLRFRVSLVLSTQLPVSAACLQRTSLNAQTGVALPKPLNAPLRDIEQNVQDSSTSQTRFL
jgi:hypothetical protein